MIGILHCFEVTFELTTVRFRALRELWKVRRVTVSGYLEAFQRYSSNVRLLFGLLQQSVEVLVDSFPRSLTKPWKKSSTNRTISQYVHEHMKCDLSVVVARLVLFLRNKGSYKEFSRCRGTDAQQLLDFLQDVSASNTTQMLAPTE
jgi:hypothetical protein